MSNYKDDDFFSNLINDLDDLDDVDLLLLDVDDVPSSGAAAPKGRSIRNEDLEFEPIDEIWSHMDEEESQQKQKKGHKTGIVIGILLFLCIAIIALLVVLKVTDADVTRLAFWRSSETTVSVTSSSEAAEEEAEAEPELEEVDEPAEEEDEDEPEEEEEQTEEEAEVVAADLSGLALLQLWGENFTPSLVGVNNLGAAQADTSQGTLDSTVASYLEQFISAARAAGYNTICTSNGKYVEAAEGSSIEAQEHATGLAVDLIDLDNQVTASIATDENFAEELAWWAEHAAEYGFILRFPADKESITGVSYLPCHFVYVGTTIAQTMAENNWCLEEYLENN